MNQKVDASLPLRSCEKCGTKIYDASITCFKCQSMGQMGQSARVVASGDWSSIGASTWAVMPIVLGAPNRQIDEQNWSLS